MFCFLIFLLLRRKILKWMEAIHLPIFERLNIIMVILMLLPSHLVKGQSRALKYKVVEKNNVIGWMNLEKKDSAHAYQITLNSEIKKRFVFLFIFIENQHAVFENGVLVQLHVYRKINNDIKVNKQTKKAGDYYKIQKGNVLKQAAISNIKCNQLSLYFFEPVNIAQVYSDNYEQYLKIEKSSDQSYVLALPDGNKSYYYYTNGICTKVKMVQSFFTVEFILST